LDVVVERRGDRNRWEDPVVTFWLCWVPSPLDFGKGPNLGGSWTSFSESFRCFPFAPLDFNSVFEREARLAVSGCSGRDSSVESPSVFRVFGIDFLAPGFEIAVEIDSV
jgi:hypothetical protein